MQKYSVAEGSSVASPHRLLLGDVRYREWGRVALVPPKNGKVGKGKVREFEGGGGESRSVRTVGRWMLSQPPLDLFHRPAGVLGNQLFAIARGSA